MYKRQWQDYPAEEVADAFEDISRYPFDGVAVHRQALHRCITYEVSQGKWETKQFVGTSLSSWEQEASWEDFGGAGTMKSRCV